MQGYIPCVPRTSQHHRDRPSLKTRVADRVNALIWRLPIPRRLQVLLSQLVYRNPPIPEERVIEALSALDEAEVSTVLIGGWGIDALTGRQLRSHADLDLLVGERDFELATDVLQKLGYEAWNRSSTGTIGELHVFSSAQTFRDSAFRVVELHAIEGDGVRSVTGSIAGYRVSCLSADHQLKAQQLSGRTWTPSLRLKHRRNLAAVEDVLQEDVNRV